MITVYKHKDLGRTQIDWLNARHHFSFGQYHDPKRMNFGPLRVINDDQIAAGSGFDMHRHHNMEIITYVRSGAILHKDSLGNDGKTAAGDVQVMSAGRGIAHAEMADENEDTTLYQIWIEPREKRLEPRWDQAEFPKEPVSGHLRLLVSGFESDKDQNPLYIHQDARIFGGVINENGTLTHEMDKKSAYVLLSKGKAVINNHVLSAGDGAEITNEPSLNIHSDAQTEILIIEVDV